MTPLDAHRLRVGNPGLGDGHEGSLTKGLLVALVLVVPFWGALAWWVLS